MLKKKLMAVGIAVVFTLSSLTTTVFAADLSNLNAGVTVKLMDPGKNVSDKNKDIKKLNKFIDSKDASWAIDAIEKLAGKGIINGIGNGIFAPQKKVTHLEALAMVFRLTDNEDKALSLNNKINPLYKGKKLAWGQGYISLALEKEILTKEDLEDFNPNEPAKRVDIAKYIMRALDDKNIDKADDYDVDDLKDLGIKDAKDVPNDSIGYVYMVYDKKIMMGDKNGKFNPTQPVTRAEMAVLLDRAEGVFNVPDSDKRKSGIVFVSADEDENEITVTVKGVSTTYEYLDDAGVYKENKIVDIDDLVKGDVLKLYFNSSRKIIFIEVLKNVVDTESKISFSTVNYSSLPQLLKDEFDDLKSTENYTAYEYNDYIYLIATMGKKNTGGYDIEIEKLTRELVNGKYTVTAVVYSDKPSSGSLNTQAIYYPSSIVKFKNFDTIKNILFVDEDNDKLDDVSIEDVGEVSSVEGEIYDLVSSSRTIKVEKSNGSKVSYTVDEDAKIDVDGDDDADFSDLEEGMLVELKIVDNVVTEIEAEYADETVEIEGTITAINSTRETINVKKSNGSIVTLEVSDDAEIEVNDEEDADFSDLEVGMVVELEVTDNEVTKIDAEDAEAVEVKGTITAISTTKETIDVKKSNGTVVKLTIPDDAEITVNEDEDESISDLELGMTVEITVVNNTVTTVIADDTEKEITGKLTGISISTEKKITVLVSGRSNTYTVKSDVKIITDDDSSAEVEDLEIGSQLTLTFVNGLLAEIEEE